MNGKVTIVEIAVCSGAVVSLLVLKYLLQRSDKPEDERPKFSSKKVTSALKNSRAPFDERGALPAFDNESDGALSNSSTGPLDQLSSLVANHDYSSHDDYSAFPVLGLTNLGNTCYVNSVIQALACLPQFAEWLQRTKRSVCPPQRFSGKRSLASAELAGEAQKLRKFTRITTSNEEAKIRTFFHSFCQLVDVLNGRLRVRTRDACYTATELISSVFGGSEFSHYQQDPDELFLFVIHLLIKAASAQSRSVLDLPLGEMKTSKTGALLTEFGSELFPLTSGATSGWNIPFQGLFYQDLLCVVCKNPRSQPLEVFHSLSLSFPSSGQYRNNIFLLENLIQSFFVPADLDSVECSHCSEAVVQQIVRTPHLKRISIAKFPKILCVHIRRAVWSDSDSWKRLDPVSFPSSLVLGTYSWLRHIGGEGASKSADIPSRCAEGGLYSSTKLAGMYSLKSVIVHVGHSSVGGHIVTYRKGPVGRKNAHEWYLTSDEFVKRLSSWREVELANPYMLFYELEMP